MRKQETGSNSTLILALLHFSLVLLLFCAISMQIENIVSNAAHRMLSEAILLPVLDGVMLEEFVKHDDDLAKSHTETTVSGDNSW